ncbi:MAG: NAD(P)H-dependent glycerol-3-phosphate dehydrogenase [Corynebacterium sp.]|nr:NAD(P)H-dependent glycerol-3-phosphate dehydrogenase [Corynebacterium sp.]
MRIAVMGAGSWGTTLAKVCADAGNTVMLWARQELAARSIQITRENARYLPGLTIPPAVTATADMSVALREAELVICAVPSQTLRANLTDWKGAMEPDALVMNLAKGVEHGTGMRMSQVMGEVLDIDMARIAVLSGPNLAREIALEQPAATVIACTDEANAQRIQQALATRYFRPYTNTDLIGAEIGGACKNIIALACGMAHGRGLGENTQATIITRGLAEITRLGVAVGAEAKTFAGLTGIGDLVATCTSPLSRNRSFGVALGRGDSIEEASTATHGQVAEGVATSESVWHVAESLGVDMPITHAVYGVCHKAVSVGAMITALMGRSKKAE